METGKTLKFFWDITFTDDKRFFSSVNFPLYDMNTNVYRASFSHSQSVTYNIGLQQYTIVT